MPSRNSLRSYFLGGYYHVYNRGVEKREIFLDSADYQFLLDCVESYLTPDNIENLQEKDPQSLFWRSKLNENEIEVVCFCLMPNHFHFLLKQNSADGVTRFMRRIMNSYVKYFNKKYERAGGLFQGKFKAALVENESYLLHLTRYIHLNAKEVGPLRTYRFSSYLHYLGDIRIPWVKNDSVLNYFQNPSFNMREFKKVVTYQKFVEDGLFDKISEGLVRDLTLE